MNSDPDWELYFYEASRINDKELVVRNLKTRSKVPANLSFATAHKESDAKQYDSAPNPTLHTEPQPNLPQKTRPRSSPSLRIANTGIQTANAQIRPLSSSSTRVTSASASSLKPAPPPIQTVDSVLKAETIPGWSKLDGGTHMYDFLSPSRLLGSLPDPSKSVDTHHLRNPLLRYRNSGQRTFSSSTLFASPSKKTEQSVRRSLSASVIRSAGSISNLSKNEENKIKPQAPNPATKKSPPRKSAKSSPLKKLAPKSPKSPENEELIKRNLQQQFNTYDLNGDGTISRKEAALLLRKNVFESGYSETDVRAILDFILGKMDFDLDHHISYEEYERCVLAEPLLRGCFGSKNYYEKV